MRKYISVIISAVMVVLFFGAPAAADLIVMKNGDKLFGKIQNPNFALYSPYGQIVCSYDFLKMISFDERKQAYGSFQTINNDSFSGSIRVDEFDIILEGGEHRSISKQHIRKVRIETRRPSYNITTAIIAMQNGDKFSGNVITEDFKVKAGYMVKLIQRDTINRIEMPSAGQGNVKILLNNGDLISGELLVEHITVEPDAVGQLTIGKSAISSIQFNASKMVLSQISRFSGSGRDSDGDGVPDDADKCPHSPGGFDVDEDGCSMDPNLAKGGNPFDRDNDGILDNIDQCPDTPRGFFVDNRGCSKIKAVFFDFDRYDLHRKFYSDLDIVVSMLIKNPAIKIQIQGHTDNIGIPEYNMDLSEKRAGEVKGYLINNGIDAERIATIGCGYTKNAASNNTASGRAQNRRAEIILVE